MKPYPIQVEISGPTALWTRPDTGSSPVSYVAPTFSAVKGVLEAILRWKSVNVRPTRCEICTPVQFHRYATNYDGPPRASDARPYPPRSGRGLGEVSKLDSRSVGPFRPETRVCEIENHELPTMLRMVFDQTAPFSQNWTSHEAIFHLPRSLRSNRSLDAT